MGVDDQQYDWQVSMQLRYVLAWKTSVKLLTWYLIGDPEAAKIIEWLLKKR